MEETQVLEDRRKKNIGCWMLLIVFVVLPFIAINFGHKSVVAGNVDRSDACFMSQKFVKQSLKAPATAQFPDWTEENCSATHTGDTWTVTSYVDAQNGFGALIRSDYTVGMAYHPDRDTWTLTNISVSSR